MGLFDFLLFWKKKPNKESVKVEQEKKEVVLEKQEAVAPESDVETKLAKPATPEPTGVVAEAIEQVTPETEGAVKETIDAVTPESNEEKETIVTKTPAELKPTETIKPVEEVSVPTALDEDVYQVKPHDDGGWQVIKHDADRARRKFDTQAECIEYCKENELKFVVYKKDGTLKE